VEHGSSFDRFTLDPSKLELRKDGRRVKLRPQPVKLLALLLWHRGEIVTREEIRRELWGEHTFVDVDRGINSCIRQLRTALGDDAESPRFIETIPREGYRFLSSVPSRSGSRAPDAGPRAGRPLRVAVAGLALVLVSAALLAVVFWPEPSPEPEPLAVRPGLVVLAFDNLRNDPSLDWLRVGLTDMLITNLSQSPGLNVVSTDKVFQLLGEAGALDASVTPQGAVERIASEVGADTAVLGSYASAGDRIRINIRVQDVTSGRIRTTMSVEGDGEASLFSMVDDLSRRLQASVGRSSVESARVPPQLSELATSSVEAYRYFAQAWQLLADGKSSEALPLFENAVAADPEWARALAMVSMMHNNLGHEREAEEFALRALALSENLEPRLRYTVELWHYARREETYGRAIEIGGKLLELEPEHAFRHIVLRRLLLLERLDEAIGHGTVFLETGRPGVLPMTALSRAYGLLGRFEEANEVLRELVEHNPTVPGAHLAMGAHLMRRGKLDAALEVLERAKALANHPLGADLVRWEVFVLRQQWDEAAGALRDRTGMQDATLRWDGLRRLAVVALHRGRSEEALSLLEDAARAYDEGRSKSAQARNEEAHLLLALGRPESALGLAKLAQEEGKGHHPEWEGLFLEGMARARLDQAEEAAAVAAKLLARTELIPAEKERRRHHHLLGELALQRGETDVAIAELEWAASMLLPRGFQSSEPLPRHVPIWYALANAYRKAGEPGPAAAWFERITDSTTERVWWPVLYARSLYRLGEISEAAGELDTACDYYSRFYALWKHADLDRDFVKNAAAKLREYGWLGVGD
jgi:DNA-binding winged helix-turn-helix (wHTH) protein/tetratricopeptide (TPR) repeat protein